MEQIYAMQRANGDWFALDHQGHLAVPLFHSSRDALIARARNWQMLLFKPVALNAGLLKQLVPVGDASAVEFWLVDDPLISLRHGRPLKHEELASLIGDQLALPTVIPLKNTLEPQRLKRDSSATETWEDEGGLSSRVA